MSEQPQPQRMQQAMPEDGDGWHQVNAGPHLHIMFHPNRQLRGRQLPLWVEEGQKPLDVALAFFEKPLRFRGLLSQAEERNVASLVDDADLARAARQIRELDAAARHKPAA